MMILMPRDGRLGIADCWALELNSSTSVADNGGFVWFAYYGRSWEINVEYTVKG